MSSGHLELPFEITSDAPDLERAYDWPWEQLRAWLTRCTVPESTALRTYRLEVGGAAGQRRDEPDALLWHRGRFRYTFPDHGGLDWVAADVVAHWLATSLRAQRVAGRGTGNGVRFGGEKAVRRGLSLVVDPIVFVRGDHWLVTPKQGLARQGSKAPELLPLKKLSRAEAALVDDVKSSGACRCGLCEALRPSAEAERRLLDAGLRRERFPWFRALTAPSPDFIARYVVALEATQAFEPVTRSPTGLTRLSWDLGELYASNPALRRALAKRRDDADDRVRAAGLLAAALAPTAPSFDTLAAGLRHGPASALAVLGGLILEPRPAKVVAPLGPLVAERRAQRANELVRYVLQRAAKGVAERCFPKGPPASWAEALR